MECGAATFVGRGISYFFPPRRLWPMSRHRAMPDRFPARFGKRWRRLSVFAAIDGVLALIGHDFRAPFSPRNLENRRSTSYKLLLTLSLNTLAAGLA